MDGGTFSWLCRILPVEIVAMIDDEICVLYRKENAVKVRELVKNNTRDDEHLYIRHNDITITMRWEVCKVCRELDQGCVYVWNLRNGCVIFTDVRGTKSLCRCQI
nr:hypothetical protein K-LCC10_0219 [Kaumoebavirus]